MSMRLLALTVLLSLAACAANITQEPGNGESPDARKEQHAAELERTSDPSAIVGKTWYWLGTLTPVERVEIDDPARYTLFLHEGGDAELQFDCNRGRGSYQISQGTISFGPLMSTRRACSQDTQSNVYERQLANAVIFFVDNGRLYIDLKADSGTMRFSVAPDDGGP